MTPEQLRAGQIVHIGPACSPQFADNRHIRLRVIGWEHSWSTPDGWIHLSGYQLDDQGRPVEKRTVFVQHDGLHLDVDATPYDYFQLAADGSTVLVIPRGNQPARTTSLSLVREQLRRHTHPPNPTTRGTRSRD